MLFLLVRVYFHDGKFLEKLDSNLDLIGFENGVYDLANGEFREGYPEDYISFSTKIDYVPMQLNDPMVKDVNKFVEQVLPIPRVREYVLKILGSVLSGKTGQEKFHVWTGCHAKGAKILMNNGSIKKVENIKVGEYLMGPDSKPREVKNLVTGKSEMYKITPSKGDSFVVNKDHILSLKATNINSIVDSKKEFRYRLKYQELNDNGLPIFKSKNFPYKHNNKKIFKKNVKYYDTKQEALLAAKKFRDINMETNEKLIKNNDIINISVSDYLNIRNKIGSRNYYLYKVPITFPKKKVLVDPYLLGSKLSNKKNIPEDYKINDKEIQLQLLAGLIDSDGYYSARCNQYEITLKLEHLIDDIVFISITLGFAATKKIKVVNDTNYYRAIIYGNGNQNIPVKLPRKMARPREIKKDNLKLGF